MAGLVWLNSPRLMPVVELEPFTFATSPRPSPAHAGPDAPEEWLSYWLDCVGDSGITNLQPLHPSSWFVSTTALLASDDNLEKFVGVIFDKKWELSERPNLSKGRFVFNGGLALWCADELVVQPHCCVDLGSLSDWRKAAAYRGSDWQMLWIGHPWLSIRFDGEGLVLSGPHESDSPVARCMVSPEALELAVAQAERELESFAHRLEPVIEKRYGPAGTTELARSLAGLTPT
jgi:hypothetical protein